MNLYEIGLKHKTDKSHYHNFTSVYGEKLNHLKNKNIRFLEVGIEHGHSLLMWNEYFKNATLYGADILDKSFLDSNKIKTFIIDQENENDLMSLPNDLDIILDDGGHTMLQQQKTLNILFNHKLKSGGYFILEDLHTSNKKYYNTHGSNEYNNTLRLLYDLKNKNLSSDNQYHITISDFNKLLSIIESIEIYELGEDSITSLIIKK